MIHPRFPLLVCCFAGLAFAGCSGGGSGSDSADASVMPVRVPCGILTCPEGYVCHVVTGGTGPDGGPSQPVRSCDPLPGECSNLATCACVAGAYTDCACVGGGGALTLTCPTQ